MRALILTLSVWLAVAGAATAQVIGGVVSGTVSGIPPPGQPPRDNRARPTIGTASIQGRIVDAESGVPLRRASVRAMPTAAGPNVNYTTFTDPDGRYAFRDLPAGTYFLNASKNGYVNWSYGQNRAFEPGKNIALADKQALESADLQLPRAGVIAGRIVDEFGEPVPDVMVNPLRYQYMAAGGRQAMPAGRGGQTNDIGEFRIFGLMTGDYFLSAVQNRFGGGNEVTDDRSGYAPTYYPQTSDLADAQPLHIDAGQSINGLTLMLIPTRTAQVTGVVVNADGEPVKNGNINAIPTERARGFGSSGATIQPDGTFTLNGLSPGTYTLRAQIAAPPPQTMGAVPSFASMPMAVVSVNGNDLSGVRLAPVVPVTLRGRITFDPPLESGRQLPVLRMFTAPSNPMDNFGVPPVAQPEPVNSDWTFAVKAVPGRVMVTVNGLPPTFMVRRVRVNGDDAINGIEANQDVDDIVFEITNRIGQITGRATDARGPATSFVAVLFPVNREAWSTRTGGPAIGRPNPQGQFTIRPLRAGDYYLAAVDHVENGQWFDPEFLGTLTTRATRVTLAEGESRAIDLELVENP